MGIVFVGMALLLAALATADGLKFTLLTSPPKYLKRFPLDQVSKQDLIGELGAPAEQATVEGPITGSIPTARMGLRHLTFVIADGVVSDVIYNNQGWPNGKTAGELQE